MAFCQYGQLFAGWSPLVTIAVSPGYQLQSVAIEQLLEQLLSAFQTMRPVGVSTASRAKNGYQGRMIPRYCTRQGPDVVSVLLHVSTSLPTNDTSISAKVPIITRGKSRPI